LKDEKKHEKDHFYFVSAKINSAKFRIN